MSGGLVFSLWTLMPLPYFSSWYAFVQSHGLITVGI